VLRAVFAVIQTVQCPYNLLKSETVKVAGKMYAEFLLLPILAFFVPATTASTTTMAAFCGSVHMSNSSNLTAAYRAMIDYDVYYSLN
jgi:hypothetical protein